MDSNISQGISDFLSETTVYIEQVDTLPFETAAELYELLDDAAKVSTMFIKEIDPELRVDVCSRQDMILERIIDFDPPYNNCVKYKKIFTPRINFCARWLNVELLKDNGIATYLLAEEINATPLIHFGTKPEDYPYLSLFPKMEVLYDDSQLGLPEPYFNHLNECYGEMDVIMLHGMYVDAANYLNRYRQLRPDGIVHCTLDMNSYWMNTTPWGSSDAVIFAQQCDIISNSCRLLRDALNRNPDVSFPCRWITNGFYNPTGIPVIAEPSKKENVILTVGRIGTAQKNNEEMLTAFALASKSISDWTLRLVGPVEPGFQEYIHSFYKTYPDLKNRVVFTGPIIDKEELFNEYKKAKVFTLSSRLEGFPNVYAEALYHGCMFVTSDIDGSDDMTNYGDLGEIYKLGDVKGLTEAFIKVCSKADMTDFEMHIPRALEYANKYYDWHRIAKKLAYMLFR